MLLLHTKKAALAVLAGSTLAAGAAAAADSDHARPRVRVSLDASWAAGSLDFPLTRHFQAFVEPGQIASDYSYPAAAGFDGGLAIRVAGDFGVAAYFGYVKRDGDATYRASLPHPLYLRRDRLVEGELSGLSHEEKAGHFDLFWARRSGNVDFTLFAGPSSFSASTDLAEPPLYDQAYPYDTVSVRQVPTVQDDKSAWGFNVGADLGYRLGSHFGVGLKGRFSRARVTFAHPASPEDDVEVDLGGFSAGLGLRLYF